MEEGTYPMPLSAWSGPWRSGPRFPAIPGAAEAIAGVSMPSWMQQETWAISLLQQQAMSDHPPRLTSSALSTQQRKMPEIFTQSGSELHV